MEEYDKVQDSLHQAAHRKCETGKLKDLQVGIFGNNFRLGTPQEIVFLLASSAAGIRLLRIAGYICQQFPPESHEKHMARKTQNPKVN